MLSYTLINLWVSYFTSIPNYRLNEPRRPPEIEIFSSSFDNGDDDGNDIGNIGDEEMKIPSTNKSSSCRSSNNNESNSSSPSKWLRYVGPMFRNYEVGESKRASQRVIENRLELGNKMISANHPGLQSASFSEVRKKKVKNFNKDTNGISISKHSFKKKKNDLGLDHTELLLPKSAVQVIHRGIFHPKSSPTHFRTPKHEIEFKIIVARSVIQNLLISSQKMTTPKVRIKLNSLYNYNPSYKHLIDHSIHLTPPTQ